MFKLCRTFLLILFLVSTTTAVYSETSWITKKSDKTKAEVKKEKKEKKEKKKKWIAKKQKNKKKFKDKAKNISKEVKSWITKKSKKNKYIKNINELPKAEIYFVARSESGDVYFGYINPKKTSQKISSADGKVKLKKNNIGFAYLNDGKTVCNVATEIEAIVKIGRYFGEVHAECTNKTNFNGDFSQRGTTGNGTLSDDDGNQVFFNFYQNIEIASKNYDKFSKRTTRIAGIPKDKKNITVEPPGKYYALLIGNSNYAKWASLTSPKNDVNAIAKILKNKYKFENVLVVPDANRSEIFKAFSKLKKLTTENDYVLIYYTGHGEQETNQAYWIPIDAGKSWDSGEWINTMDIGVAVQNIKARHTLLMVDSCYVGKIYKGSDKNILNKAKENLEAAQINKLLNKKGRIFMASGGEEPVQDAVVGKHSLFAYKFIDLLKNNNSYITATNIFIEISKYHGELDQTPIIGTQKEWGHLGGDFVFVAKN